MMRRGALIILEGCDRVGKSTHSKLLVQALKEEGHQAEVLQFPNRSTLIGSVINKYLEGSSDLDDHAIHLLFSANRWEMVPKMLKSLNSGVSLVVDRYAYSGVAFSGAKKGMDLEWCKQSDVGLPKPDLVLYLELPPGANTSRSGFGDERYENVDFQSKVKEVYSSLKDDSWQKEVTCYVLVGDSEKRLCASNLTMSTVPPSEMSEWTLIINADQDIQEVHSEIKKHAKQAIENVNISGCQRLWT